LPLQLKCYYIIEDILEIKLKSVFLLLQLCQARSEKERKEGHALLMKKYWT